MCTRLRLYPAWNIIGGKIMLKKISGSNVAFKSISFASILTTSLRNEYKYVLLDAG